jgi:DNA-binding transcriptional ArsR family regulator
MVDRDEVLRLHAAVCKGLSDPKRLMILEALRDGERTVSDLCHALELPQANTSQHLAILREKGLARVRREGQYSYYSVSSPKILQAMDLLHEVMDEALSEPAALGMQWPSSGEERPEH